MSQNLTQPPELIYIIGHDASGNRVPLNTNGEWYNGSSDFNIQTEDACNLLTEAGDAIVQEASP